MPIFAQPCGTEKYDSVLDTLPLECLERPDVIREDTERSRLIAVQKVLVSISKT
jgi:hypothetical protein